MFSLFFKEVRLPIWNTKLVLVNLKYIEKKVCWSGLLVSKVLSIDFFSSFTVEFCFRIIDTFVV